MNCTMSNAELATQTQISDPTDKKNSTQVEIRFCRTFSRYFNLVAQRPLLDSNILDKFNSFPTLNFRPSFQLETEQIRISFRLILRENSNSATHKNFILHKTDPK